MEEKGKAGTKAGGACRGKRALKFRMSWKALLQRHLMGAVPCLFLLCGGAFLASSEAEAIYITAYGAVSGSGTKEDPVSGDPEISVLDSIQPGAWFRSLTPVHGRELSFQAVYEPGLYTLLFHASGGEIPGVGEELPVEIHYNDGSGASSDTVTLPEEPYREGYTFSGWYLKGNQSPDGCMLQDGSRYMIATEDAEDRKQAEVLAHAAVARALWRKTSPEFPKDGKEASDPQKGEEKKDIWEVDHSNNHVIEKLEKAEDQAQYSRLHGRTSWQYGRVRLDAEIEHAGAYRWYVNGTEQAEQGPRLMLSNVKRDLNQAEIRCRVILDDEKTELEYRTRLTVYHLPEFGTLGFSFRETGKPAETD